MGSEFPKSTSVWNFDFILQEHPLKKEENVKVTTLASRDNVSIHLIQVRGTVPLHVHDWSDENIYIIKGSGKLAIGREEYTVRPGDVIHVPKGEEHFFINASKEPAVVLSLYTPTFRKGDRRWIKK